MIEIDLDDQGQAFVRGDIFDEIREHFSVENPGAKYQRRFNRFIPTRRYAITPTGRCDVGLVPEITKYLTSKPYSNKINVSMSVQDTLIPARVWYSDEFTTDPYKLSILLRDYQEEIVRKCLEIGRGTVILATAGGKTLTMASLISRISTFYSGVKGLLIVPDRGLVEQTYNDFIEYKVPFTISKWTGDDDLNISSDIIIANLSILQSCKSSIDWIRHIDLLVIDEVHKLRQGNKVNKIIKKIKTPLKFGFTGTMPEDKLDQWNIIGKIGPILYERSSFDLRSENYIANAEIIKLQLVHATTLKGFSDNKYRREVEHLIESKFRNDTIAKLANKVSNNILIMVDFIRHGETLYDACKNICIGKQVFFICGDVELEEREKIKQLVEQSTNIVIIAISKIFSTGINIKNLHYIVFAGGGKAKVKVVQSIGRGLRLHKDKSRLIIVDIQDNFKYSLAHAAKRSLLYELEKIKSCTRELREAKS